MAICAPALVDQRPAPSAPLSPAQRSKRASTLLREGVLRVERPVVAELPLVLDSPHSGTIMPGDFTPLLPDEVWLRTADRYVDELFASAVDHGASLLAALFPRAYIDPNRAVDDLDPQLLREPWHGRLRPGPKTRDGKGLIWRLAAKGRAIYGDGLSVAEVEARIGGYYRPYHTVLKRLLTALRRRHGHVLHLNCHSMKDIPPGTGVVPGFGTVHGPGAVDVNSVRRADVVLSDRLGRSCSRDVLEVARAALVRRGLRVAINDPFIGAEIVRRTGAPARRCEALQIEVRRPLFMDERTMLRRPDFAAFKALLDGFVGELAHYVQARG